MGHLNVDARKLPIDKAAYAPGANNPNTYFGLPQNIEFCSQCVISNQRPNSAAEYRHTAESKKDTIRLEGGVCDACRQAEAKKAIINWDEREQELMELCDRYRSKDGSYDCLVPGSGGKDSFYQSHVLKYKYGMNPLTVTWAPHMYTDWGRRNFDKWIHSGFDNYLMTSSGRSKRLLTRLAVENLFHPFQPFIFGQKALAPKLALRFDIPLIFYGENEAEYGNPVADNSSAKRDFKYFAETNEADLYLGGVSIKSLLEDYGLSRSDLDTFLPSNPADLESRGVEVHYLGYYVKWHPQQAYYYAVEHGGFEASPERTAGTYSKYNSIDDKIDDFHYHTTYIKFGIGRTTYDASQEIRSGDIERDEGVALIKRYDGEFPDRFAKEVFEYLTIDEKSFPQAHKLFEHPEMNKEYYDALCDKFRSPHLWMQENGEWRLRQRVFDDAL